MRQSHCRLSAHNQSISAQIEFMMSNWDFPAGSRSILRTSFLPGLHTVPEILLSAPCSFQLMLLTCTYRLSSCLQSSPFNYRPGRACRRTPPDTGDGSM